VAKPRSRVGLSASVSWEGAGKCPSGSIVSFAQVGYGGSWISGARAPFVDDGSNLGSGVTPSGCLEYPIWPNTSQTLFIDEPSTWTGAHFITCMLCIEPCCGGNGKGNGRRILQMGPCKKWKAGDTGDLATFPDANASEVLTIWRAAVATKYPDWMKCYHCDSARNL
jgi:hypothetical protein